MRIALVAESFYPSVDATTTTLKATADHLVDLGHTVCAEPSTRSSPIPVAPCSAPMRGRSRRPAPGRTPSTS